MINQLHTNTRLSTTIISSQIDPFRLLFLELYMKAMRSSKIGWNFTSISQPLKHINNIQYEHMK